jgi:epoxyqueuosine reductase QueG
MDRQYIQQLVNDLSDNSPTNFLQPPATDEQAGDKSDDNNFARNNYFGAGEFDAAIYNVGKEDKYIGMRFFKRPIFSVGAAHDPGFEAIRRPGVVGPHHKLPGDWVEGAKTVISFFLPYSDRVVNSNMENEKLVSMEWMFTRVDGQKHLLSTAQTVVNALVNEGYRAVAPQIDDRYILKAAAGHGNDDFPEFSSNWSERHVAYVTGLGTFGLNTNFISKVGCAGRIISVVTDWECAPDEKDYDGYLDYCSACGACIKKCPAGAIFQGCTKDHNRCSDFVRKMCAPYSPRYGCGKCQCGIPCQGKHM